MLTTVQLAKKAKVPRATLQYWISEGKLSAPKLEIRSGRAVRAWSEADVERARKLKGALRRGPEAGSRTKKGKK